MSDSSGNWLNKLFKNVSQPPPKPDPGVIPKPTLEKGLQPGATYKKGDFIGQRYKVYEVLGTGGFGVVYLVFSHEMYGVYALKTFRDEFLTDQEVRKRFHKEASVWVELGRHPYLVRANFVDEVSGRLYIAMEYIASDEEGLNSLEGYLQRRPPDLIQSLRWAIQVCHGMEYAFSKGIRAHRDLKPANIMISQDMTAMITDFGLAGVISESPMLHTAKTGALSGQTLLGEGFGTPTHMSPEQFENAAGCDERSDIYSFGIVLYQMAAGGRLPFLAPLPRDGSHQAMTAFWQVMHKLHRESPVPRLDSPLFPIIQRCLEKLPEKRYKSFEEFREDLEPLLKQQAGEVIHPPQLNELEAWEWRNKGFSLISLGCYEEAIRCLDKALELDPSDEDSWNNKGVSLINLGRYEEAIRCLDKSLEVVDAWNNKDNRPYEPDLWFDPRGEDAWNNKGICLESMGRHEEAIRCYDKALELNPNNINARYNKALAEDKLGHKEQAVRSYQQVLAIASTQHAKLIEHARQRLRELEGK